MKLFTMSLLGSIFINFSFVALSYLISGTTGHGSSILSYGAELIIFWFGLSIILPAIVLFFIWRIYEKRHIESGKKSYMIHFTFAMFVFTIALVYISQSLLNQRNAMNAQQHKFNNQLQLMEEQRIRGQN